MFMLDNVPIFKNRTEAGRRLALKLLSYKPKHPLILALPRGGVPVDYEIARALKAPLDTIVVRKIGAPFNPEFAVGAIAPNGVVIIDSETVQSLGISKKDINYIIEKEKLEMERRILLYHSGEYSRDVLAETIIIVDDGLATGLTARVAIQSVILTHKPKEIVFAVPIGSKDIVRALRDTVSVVCLEEVDNLMAIGYWYKEFNQVTDEEVIEYLEKAN